MKKEGGDFTNVGKIQRNLIWDIDNVDKENIIDEMQDNE